MPPSSTVKKLTSLHKRPLIFFSSQAQSNIKNDFAIYSVGRSPTRKGGKRKINTETYSCDDLLSPQESCTLHRVIELVHEHIVSFYTHSWPGGNRPFSKFTTIF